MKVIRNIVNNSGTIKELKKKNYSNSGIKNWYTVNTGKLCPADWHVPSDAEWMILTTYLGGESIAGGKLKEIGTSHWNSPNTGASNDTRFIALPGGGRDVSFNYIAAYSGF